MTDASTSGRGSFPVLALFMLAIAVGGFIYAGLGIVGFYEAQIPSHWQQTAGQVVEHGVSVISKAGADGSERETFKAKVRYRYEVGGQFYLGTQLSRHHPERTLRGVAETEVEDLPRGTNVTVYFNPDDPSDAVLRKSDVIGPMQAISAGLAIGLTCFALFGISALRAKRTA